MNMGLNELTYEEARKKYSFLRPTRRDYTRVREVPPDDKGQGALFAYAPEQSGYVSVDMFTTDGVRAVPAVVNINCPAGDVDRVVDAVAAGDFEAVQRLGKEKKA